MNGRFEIWDGEAGALADANATPVAVGVKLEVISDNVEVRQGYTGACDHFRGHSVESVRAELK